MINREDMELSELWTSISDMMSGLMLVFLLIAVAFMVEVTRNTKDQIDYKKRLEEIIRQYIELEHDLQEELKITFPKEYWEKWDIEILPDNTVRFNSPDVKFSRGSAKVTPGFKYLLNDFFPKYVNVLNQPKYRDFIEEIRIEGHTSSIWFGRSEKEDYLKNLELSQRRAKAVLEYCINRPEVQKDFQWLTSVFRANGLSSSKLLDVNGELVSVSGKPEDPERSRRVEFRVQTKAHKALEKLEQLRQEMIAKEK